MNELDIALEKVTFELLESLKKGQTVELTKGFELYRFRYRPDQIVIWDIVKRENILCIDYNRKKDYINFHPY